jgi:hypothetical protein
MKQIGRNAGTVFFVSPMTIAPSIQKASEPESAASEAFLNPYSLFLRLQEAERSLR